MPNRERVEPVFNYSPTAVTFHVVAELKDVPGALQDILDRLTKVKANLVATTSSRNINGPNATASLILVPTGEEITKAKLKSLVDASPFVLGSEVNESESGILIAHSLFPIRLMTGQRVMVLRTELASKMMNSIRERFGSGGDLIIYEEGFEAGRNDASTLIKMMGSGAIYENAGLLVQLRTALGWCKAEFLDFQRSPYMSRVKVTDCFECEGRRSKTPYSQFLRGHFAGLATGYVGKPVNCTETKCIAAGSPYCEFVLEESPTNPKRQPTRSDH